MDRRQVDDVEAHVCGVLQSRVTRPEGAVLAGRAGGRRKELVPSAEVRELRLHHELEDVRRTAGSLERWIALCQLEHDRIAADSGGLLRAALRRVQAVRRR